MMHGCRVALVVGLLSLLAGASAIAQDADPAGPAVGPDVGVTAATSCPDALGPAPDAGAGQTVVAVFFSCDDGSNSTFPVVKSWRLVPSGTASEILTATMDHLVAGPSPGDIAAGLSSWFSAETADQVVSAAVGPNGSATVDFDPDLRTIIPGASSSAGSAMLLRELDATVLQFAGVTSATYAFGGVCEDFWNFVQIGGCPLRTGELVSEILVSNRIASGRAEYVFGFGRPNQLLLVGDWDGDGTDGFAARSGNAYTLADQYGVPNRTIGYGKAGDDVYVGDWDGNGTDTLAVRRGNLFFVRNRPGTGKADQVLSYGRAGDEVFVGDWDGNGTDTLGVRRGNIFYLRNRLTSGVASVILGYGRAGDEVFVGDWDGSDTDTLAVRRGNTIYLRNDLRSGPAQIVIGYGMATDRLLVGDYDDDRIDTFAARRPPPVP